MIIRKSRFSNSIPIHEFNKIHFWCAVLVWLLMAFALYSLFFVVRESIRYMTILDAYNDMLVLSVQEHHFYNFFYAAFACLISWGVVTDLYLKSLPYSTRKLGHKRTMIRNDQTFITWYSFYWFSKLAVVISLLSANIPLFTESPFYPDYLYLFVIFLLVIFLQQWMSIRWAFKNRGVKPMGLVALVILGVSFLFSRIDLIDPQTMNHHFLKNTISYNYSVHVPTASETITYRHFYSTPIYLGFQHNSKVGEAKIVENSSGYIRELNDQEAQEYILGSRKSYEDSYGSGWETFSLALVIDTAVKMKDVKRLHRIIESSFDKPYAAQKIIYKTQAYIPLGITKYVRSTCPEIKNAADRLVNGEVLPRLQHLPIQCRPIDSVDLKYHILDISIVNNITL